MSKKAERAEKLMPGGIPRWIRCYDNGGRSFDRYTVVYTGRYACRSGCDYVAMSAHPFHPQGFGQHGSARWPIDVVGNAWGGPAIGKSCHIGKRIAFTDLPADCQTLVLTNYRALWHLV